MDVLAIRMPKPTEIIVSNKEDQWSIENVEFWTSAASNGSHVALLQHLLSFLVSIFIMSSEGTGKWRMYLGF